MEQHEEIYQAYVEILKEELRPAMGCTEPISIAYAAATARRILNCIPQKVLLKVSGNIIKNVKSVIVPHTGGLRGIPAAAAAGIIAGDDEKQLQVISEVSNEQVEKIHQYLRETEIKVEVADRGHIFDLEVVVYAGDDTASVRIVDCHTNIVEMNKNQISLMKDEAQQGQKEQEKKEICHDCLNVEQIIEFANQVKVDDIEEVIGRQISYNMAIAEEGMKNCYGANVGKVLMNHYTTDVRTKARAMAAAGSDARMNGCELPVVINSGSGNQGMTASIPVIVFARDQQASKEETYRALVVSNLITIHLKTGIGRLSAYCGAISAGAGCGAGIAYLKGGRYDAIAHTIVNALAMISGTVCDGAKASCAAKIASAVEAGMLGYYMYEDGQEFCGGDGIVKKGVENTIRNVGKLASVGMTGTDKEIIHLMVNEE